MTFIRLNGEKSNLKNTSFLYLEPEIFLVWYLVTLKWPLMSSSDGLCKKQVFHAKNYARRTCFIAKVRETNIPTEGTFIGVYVCDTLIYMSTHNLYRQE